MTSRMPTWTSTPASCARGGGDQRGQRSRLLRLQGDPPAPRHPAAGDGRRRQQSWSCISCRRPGRAGHSATARTLPPVTSTTCPSTAPSSLPSSGMPGPTAIARDLLARLYPGHKMVQTDLDPVAAGGGGITASPPSTCLILRAGRLWPGVTQDKGRLGALVPAGVPMVPRSDPRHADLVRLDVSGLAQGCRARPQPDPPPAASRALRSPGRAGGGTCTSPGQRVWTRMP